MLEYGTVTEAPLGPWGKTLLYEGTIAAIHSVEVPMVENVKDRVTLRMSGGRSAPLHRPTWRFRNQTSTSDIGPQVGTEELHSLHSGRTCL